MNVENENRLLRSAEIRAIRALRLALTVLLDARADFVANFAGDPGDDEPEEIERARVKAWNIMGPLLIQASKDIETFAKSGGLGADCTARTIELCESILKMLKQEGMERIKPNIEKLLAHPDNPISESPAEDESER